MSRSWWLADHWIKASAMAISAPWSMHKDLVNSVLDALHYCCPHLSNRRRLNLWNMALLLAKVIQIIKYLNAYNCGHVFLLNKELFLSFLWINLKYEYKIICGTRLTNVLIWNLSEGMFTLLCWSDSDQIFFALMFHRCGPFSVMLTHKCEFFFLLL